MLSEERAQNVEAREFSRLYAVDNVEGVTLRAFATVTVNAHPRLSISVPHFTCSPTTTTTSYSIHCPALLHSDSPLMSTDALPRASSSTTLDDTGLIGVSIPIPIPIERERSLDRESSSDISEASVGSLKRAADDEPELGGGRKKMREGASGSRDRERTEMELDDGSRMDSLEKELEIYRSINGNGKRKEREGVELATGANAKCNAEERLPAVDGQALAEDLSQELQCGCCAELVYKPVVVMPCEHFFCGSCCQLWIKNGGTNCPACRGPSTSVNPSRHIQAMVDVLLRAAPHKQRAIGERQQADDIYPSLKTFRIPPPRTPSPAPSIPPSTEFVRPCPHCSGHNPHGWSCPHPVAEGTWRIDDGAPPGHGFCANCETLLALTAPSTTRCDFCLSAFCGIQVPGRCHAVPLSSQHPHGFSDVGDLIQSAEIYEAFDGNTVEVEMMLEYMANHELTPRAVYRQIIAFYQSKPTKFAPLIEMDLFTDIHGVPAPPYYPPRSSSRASASSSSASVTNDTTANAHSPPAPDANRNRICRLCAAEVLIYSIKSWWIRERRNAVKKGKMQERKDCEHGRNCDDINDPAHGKEFNHIIIPMEEEEPFRNPSPAASSSSSSSSHGGSSSSTPVNNSVSGGSSSSSSAGSVPNSHSSSSSSRSSPRRAGGALNGPPPNLPGLAELGIPLPIPPFGAGVGAGSLPHFLFNRNGAAGSPDGLQGLHAFLGERFVRTGLQQQQQQQQQQHQHTTQENAVPIPGSSQSQNAVEAALAQVSGYESDGSNHLPSQSASQGQSQSHPESQRYFMDGQSSEITPDACASDQRLAVVMERQREREREREFEARYVASFAQALLSTEEAEADLRSIRNAQALAQSGMGMGMSLGSMESMENMDAGARWGAISPLAYEQVPLQPRAMDGVLGSAPSAGSSQVHSYPSSQF